MLCDRHVSEPPNAPNISATPLLEKVGAEHRLRFFPNQDTMPIGGFGNLIALPLQRRAREAGNSVFVDEKLAPYADQWAFLSALKRNVPWTPIFDRRIIFRAPHCHLLFRPLPTRRRTRRWTTRPLKLADSRTTASEI
jgi:hypothetical protein